MDTYKVNETRPATKEAWQQIYTRLKNGGKLLVQVTHTSASNMSYRYSVRLAYKNEAGEIDFQSLAYWIAAVTGQTVVSKYYGDELRGNGIGTDRFFLASLEVAHILKDYGFISDVYEIATRNTYKEI
jgi:hypothetical protein